ncbi:MAG: U32 family peptidase, partial [Rubripirellula sp.]
DIRKIAEATDVELEVFVHGALCVSYSGQCFSSEAWGGRSANRGKCAQACRLSYDLIVDGEARDLGAYRYLLSPGDLAAIEQIPELMDIGVACVKIEGRYKDANYVAMTTRAYRDAIDLAAIGINNSLDPQQAQDLEQIYSRGLGPHFLSGTNHQTVVIGRAPRHRGVLVGSVIEVKKNAVVVETQIAIKRGDGVVFDAADWRSPDEPEEGGHVYEVKPIRSNVELGSTQAQVAGKANDNDDDSYVHAEAGDLVRLEFGFGDINFDRIRPGDKLWRSHDPQLTKRLKPLTKNETPVFTRAISFEVVANLGQPLEVVATAMSEDEDSAIAVAFEHDEPLTQASNRALDIDLLKDKLGRLGGTPYHLGDIELQTTGDVFVPTSLLNQVRRSLVDALFEASGEVAPIAAQPVLDDTLSQFRQSFDASTDARPLCSSDEPKILAKLHLLVRTAEQLDAALALKDKFEIASITLDYLELYGLRPAVEKIRDAGIRPRVASPRILKPSEQNVIKFLLSLQCDILIRSAGLLHDLQQKDAEERLADGCELIGDFSLNVANSLSAFRLLDAGLSRITPTYDLNAKQIDDLLTHIPSDRLELICFSHLPVFHTEHCVFCRFLSDGTDNTNCGHPCETHKVSVRDSQGRAHPVMADVGCRNTIFGAEAHTDITAIAGWLRLGFEHFRIELVHQNAEQTAAILEGFASFFSGNRSGSELKQELDTHSGQGTTEGSLFVPLGFKDLVQLS